MKRLILIGLLVLIFGRIPPTSAAPTAVYLVNSTNDTDDGTCNASHCSLREAIDAANSGGGIDTIRFDFTTATTIQPDNPLPDITGRVTIDGITGTGSTCPTSASTPANLKITIDGINANVDSNGFVFADGSDFSDVFGLNIVRFDDDGIEIQQGSDGIAVTCNHFGLPNSDSGGFANGGYGVRTASILNEIGGSDHADRNVIVGTRGMNITGNVNAIYNNYIGTTRDGSVGLGIVDPSSIGIFVNSDGNTFENNIIGGYNTGVRLITDNSSNQFHSNKIGTDRTGNNAIANGLGIEIADATQLTIGGSAANGNVIAFNTGAGIELTDSDNVTISHNIIHSNLVGLETLSSVSQFFNDDNTLTSNTVYDNSEDGLRLAFSDRADVQSNTIYDNGHNGINLEGSNDATVQSNTIYGNGLSGIRVARFNEGNSLRQNAIYDNGALGIDLIENAGGGGTGITPNDTDDNDTAFDGGNALQNFPVLNSADAAGNISGSFQRDTANTFGYTVDVYRNDACDDQTLNGVPHGEGKTWVASFDIGLGVTQETFNWSHDLPNQPTGDFLTLTATDYQGNTSEFSNCVEIEPLAFVVDSASNADDKEPDGVCQTVVGVCTLPAAIQEANALGGANITFNIAGPANIFLVDPLVVSVPIVLDGSTNSGANCASQTQTVQIIGQAIPAGNHILTLASGSSGSTIKGLVFVDAPLDGIHIDSNNNVIVCNRVGVQSNGSALANGEDGVHVDGGTGNQIGGITSADANLIQNNSSAAVRVDNGAQNTTIEGNQIANSGRHAINIQDSTDVTIAANDILDSGTIANGSGIRIVGSSDITIGGAQSSLGNIIADYSGSGVFMDNTVSDGLIQNNIIGTTSRRAPAVNMFDGIHIDDDVSNVIIRDNSISQNNRNGVRVDNDSLGIQILNNKITGNGGIGIDLGENGLTANDDGNQDSDEGANGLQNYPIITSVNATSGEITFELYSQASKTYLVQLFANDNCDGTHGEGATFIGELSVSTDGNGYVQEVWKFGGFSADDIITATATDTVKDGTSEFSECGPLTPPTGVRIRNQLSDNSDQLSVITGLSSLLLLTLGAWWFRPAESTNRTPENKKGSRP